MIQFILENTFINKSMKKKREFTIVNVKYQSFQVVQQFLLDLSFSEYQTYLIKSISD